MEPHPTWCPEEHLEGDVDERWYAVDLTDFEEIESEDHHGDVLVGVTRAGLDAITRLAEVELGPPEPVVPSGPE